MVKYIYQFFNTYEKPILFQNVVVAAANLTLKDYLSILAQIISIITMVLSAAIMADNHFKIFKKSNSNKETEKQVEADTEKEGNH